MPGENGPATPPADGAPPAVESKDDATASAPAEAPKVVSVVETKAAAEPEAESVPSAAEADKATEGTNTLFLASSGKLIFASY